MSTTRSSLCDTLAVVNKGSLFRAATVEKMPPKKEGNNHSSIGSGKLTKEEERLLLESSRQVTRTTSALFYGNAFIVSALPLCKLPCSY